MTKQRITDLIVLCVLLGGLSLAWDRVADNVQRIGGFIDQHTAQAHPVPLPGRTGTLGIRG
jgi:hypothetical protein